MKAEVKAVSPGIFFGLLCLFLGIFWAAILVTQHDLLHSWLSPEEGIVRSGGGDHHGEQLGGDGGGEGLLQGRNREVESTQGKSNQGKSNQGKSGGHDHNDGHHDHHDHGDAGHAGHHDDGHHGEESGTQGLGEGGHHGEESGGEGVEGVGHHNDPLSELAHLRLMRGHVHWMGLGLVTLAVSAILVLIGGSAILLRTSSLLTGLGSVLYPISWILMGLRTSKVGPALAEASVSVIVGPALILVLGGIGLAMVNLLLRFFASPD